MSLRKFFHTVMLTDIDNWFAKFSERAVMTVLMIKIFCTV